MATPNIVEVASLIGDPSRAAMLINLLGGKALPASELARVARVTPQTASSHPGKMDTGFRYYIPWSEVVGELWD